MTRDKRYVIRIQKNHETIRPVVLFAFLAVVCLPFQTLTVGGVGILMLISLPLLGLSLPALLGRIGRTSWDKATLLLAGFFAFNILAYAWTPYFSLRSLYNYIKIVMIVMCLYCQSYSRKEKDFLLLGSILAALIVFLFMVTGNNVGYKSGRMTVAVFGVTQDPNYLGYLFLVPMAAAVSLVMKHKSGFVKILGLGLAGICLFCVMTTGSRGALLGLIAVVVVCVIRRFRGLGAKILFCVAMLILALILYGFVLTLLPDHIAARFSIQDIVQTRGTRRLDIWKSAFQVMGESPYKILLGFGISSSQHLLLDGYAAHNFFIQLVLEVGIVGLSLLLGFLWIWVKRMLKYDTMGLSILLGCMAMAMTLSVNTVYYFWFAFILGIVCSDARPDRAEAERQ